MQDSMLITNQLELGTSLSLVPKDPDALVSIRPEARLGEALRI